MCNIDGRYVRPVLVPGNFKKLFVGEVVFNDLNRPCPASVANLFFFQLDSREERSVV